AGRLGVLILDGLLRQGALVEPQSPDRLTTPAPTAPYVLGPPATAVFGRLGVDLDALLTRPRSARPLLRFCVDWTEQRYHLAGALGAAVLVRAEAARWVVRRPGSRAVEVTDAGRRAFRDALGISAVAA
ncbi:MAG TPA: transcriptional regulator, partial [Mycobacterium sp.]|nr:transcriptional regulator [Mycobacterium sp.]